MIRSQIPLSFPPRPSCTQQNLEVRSEREGGVVWGWGRPAVVNGSAVRVHLGRGGSAGVDYRSLRLEKPTLPHLFSQDTREAYDGLHLCRSLSLSLSLRFPKDVKSLMLGCSGTFRKQEYGGKFERKSYTQCTAGAK